MAAWLDGQPAPGDQIRTVANLISAARTPLIIADAVDLAAAAAIVDLAKQASAHLDHVNPMGLAPMQEPGQGYLGTTPSEADLRADTILIVGPVGYDPDSDAMLRRLMQKKAGRKLIRICANDDTVPTTAAETFTLDALSLRETLGLIHARLQEKPVNAPTAVVEKVDTLVKTLSATKYGVALFAQGVIDDLSQFALMSLLNSLSKETRFSLLPFGIAPGQSELTRMSLSLTGLPPPLKFANNRATHDTWLHCARAVANRGEADLAVWISSTNNEPPEWLSKADKSVCICANTSPVANTAIQVQIGLAGIDHDAIIEPDDIGAYIRVPARAPNTAVPSAATTIHAITKHIAQNAKETAA